MAAPSLHHGHGRSADGLRSDDAQLSQLRPSPATAAGLSDAASATQGAKTKEVSSVTTSVKQEQQSAAAAALTPIHGNGISKEKVSSTSSSVSDPRASDPVNISNSADSPVKPQKKKKSSVGLN